MSKQGEIGPQLWKLKSIRIQQRACTEIMKKQDLQKAERNCTRTLATMVDAWDGKSFVVGAQP